jgi:hypothetical protein
VTRVKIAGCSLRIFQLVRIQLAYKGPRTAAGIEGVFSD